MLIDLRSGFLNLKTQLFQIAVITFYWKLFCAAFIFDHCSTNTSAFGIYGCGFKHADLAFTRQTLSGAQKCLFFIVLLFYFIFILTNREKFGHFPESKTAVGLGHAPVVLCLMFNH